MYSVLDLHKLNTPTWSSHRLYKEDKDNQAVSVFTLPVFVSVSSSKGDCRWSALTHWWFGKHGPLLKNCPLYTMLVRHTYTCLHVLQRVPWASPCVSALQFIYPSLDLRILRCQYQKSLWWTSYYLFYCLCLEGEGAWEMGVCMFTFRTQRQDRLSRCTD